MPEENGDEIEGKEEESSDEIEENEKKKFIMKKKV